MIRTAVQFWLTFKARPWVVEPTPFESREHMENWLETMRNKPGYILDELWILDRVSDIGYAIGGEAFKIAQRLGIERTTELVDGFLSSLTDNNKLTTLRDDQIENLTDLLRAAEI